MCLICEATEQVLATDAADGRARGQFAFDQRRAEMLGALIEYWTSKEARGHAGDYLHDKGFSRVEIRDHGPAIVLIMSELKDRKIVPLMPQ